MEQMLYREYTENSDNIQEINVENVAPGGRLTLFYIYNTDKTHLLFSLQLFCRCFVFLKHKYIFADVLLIEELKNLMSSAV